MSVERLDLIAGTRRLRALPAPRAEVELAEVAADAGLRRVCILAWRDLDDAEAGGSELHAAMVAERWAAAGIDVEVRTSRAAGLPAVVERDGYRVTRRGGRHLLFPRVAAAGALGRVDRGDGLVEIWNGMPFFSPVWGRGPRVVFLHHVHDEMWPMTLKPAVLARLGRAIELKLAPPLYRGVRVVTLSESSRDEIVNMLGLPADNVTVVPPGVDRRFRPGGRRAGVPLVVAVGRLTPVKRFGALIDALAALRVDHPTLEAVIAGEGYERTNLEARIARHGAAGWLHLPGRLSDDDLISLYRRAWVVASASAREGWGMTLTEAGACGTPAVATRIAGHIDAVVDGGSGLLVDDDTELRDALNRVLVDRRLRERLSAGAVAVAARHTWDATARGTLAALAAEARSTP